MDRLGDDPVRREEHHHGELVGHDPAGHAAAGDQRGGQQDAGAGVLERRPARQAEQPTAPRGRATRAAGPSRRRKPDRRSPMAGTATNAATPRVPPSASTSCSVRVEVEAGVGSRHLPEHQHGDHQHDGVADRCDGGEREPVPGVEHGRGHGAEGVEQHLRDEEPQQVGGERLLLRRDRRIVDTRGEEVGEPRRRDDAERPSPRRARPRRSTAGRRPPPRRGGCSPRPKWSTKVGTSTADSAPAASSSKSTFDTLFEAWKALPR